MRALHVLVVGLAIIIGASLALGAIGVSPWVRLPLSGAAGVALGEFAFWWAMPSRASDNPRTYRTMFLHLPYTYTLRSQGPYQAIRRKG